MKGEWYAIIGLALLTLGLIPLAISVTDRVVRRNKQTGRLTRADLLEAFGLFLMAAGVATLACLAVARGMFWILEAPMKLLIGWVQYLDRVEKDIRPDATHVVSALVCLVGTVVVAHLFFRSLATAASRAWPIKRTFQVLVVVVLMFVSGLAVVGLVQQTSWLIRTPEPLVKDNRSIS
jgi:hypothetical protein